MQTQTASAINPLAVLKPTKVARQYSLEEYLRREERSTERFEYYDGTITRVPMAKGPHNLISANAVIALGKAIEASGGDFLIFSNSQKVYLPTLNFGIYPDALVISESPKYWDTNEVLLINPLLIVEVLSKSTRAYDKKEKFDEYQTLPSFREYVLVEQGKAQVETRFREEPGLWRYTTYTDLSDQIVLKSIGCSISMSEVYRRVQLKD